MVVTRPFDIQRQFSRRKRLSRKSKVGDALIEILSRKGRKVKRETKEKDGVFHRKSVPTFFPFRSLSPSFGHFVSALPSSRFNLPSSSRSHIPIQSKITLSLLFTTSSYRRATPYYSSYVNEFRLIIWERSRTENENGGNVGVRGLAPKRG